MKWGFALLGAMVAGAAVTACGSGSPATPQAPDGTMTGADGGTGATTASVTFHRDVEPILQLHCQSCHVTGGIAPMPLMTYADAQPFAASMKAKTGAKLMPPWGAQKTPDCAPRFAWRDDPSLTDAQIATIAAWSDGGAVEGDPADAPPPATPPSLELSGKTNELAPPAPYSLNATTDEFRCFVFDPNLTTTMYLNGSQVVPGNPTIVHHVLLYSVPGGAASITAPLDASNSYDCFGGPGVVAGLVSAWAPGGLPSDFPANVGIPLAAGTALVMQIHYHPHTVSSNVNAPDTTRFQMRLTPQKPEYFVDPRLIGNFDTAVAAGTGLLPDPDDRGGVEFRIPADSASHTETMQFTVPAALGKLAPRIYGLGAHMHLVGTAEQVTIARTAATASDPESECLLGVPAWDFDWQRRYDYDTDLATLPAASTGDVLKIACKYDNTMQNPAVATNLLNEGLASPTDVYLGESTEDEMCLAPIDFVYKAP